MAPADELWFRVDGEPVPKGRARARLSTTRTGRPFMHHFTPLETVRYERKVREVCQLHANVRSWVWTPSDRFEVSVLVFRTHEGRGGDADNYLKTVLDGINGVAFRDDRYVRRVETDVYQDATCPRIEVRVRKVGVGRRR